MHSWLIGGEFRIIPGRRPIEEVALAELGIGWRHNNGPQRLNHRSFLFVAVGQEELGERIHESLIGRLQEFIKDESLALDLLLGRHRREGGVFFADDVLDGL